MSAGDVTRVELIGLSACQTDGCGLAELWMIGRVWIIVCQRCGCHREARA